MPTITFGDDLLLLVDLVMILTGSEDSVLSRA